MEDLSKFLPTADMQADFELFKNMTPEERAMFQENAGTEDRSDAGR